MKSPSVGTLDMERLRKDTGNARVRDFVPSVPDFVPSVPDFVPSVPDAEYLTSAAEESLVRELVSKSSYKSGCTRPRDDSEEITRRELHVRVYQAPCSSSTR